MKRLQKSSCCGEYLVKLSGMFICSGCERLSVEKTFENYAYRQPYMDDRPRVWGHVLPVGIDE